MGFPIQLRLFCTGGGGRGFGREPHQPAGGGCGPRPGPCCSRISLPICRCGRCSRCSRTKPSYLNGLAVSGGSLSVDEHREVHPGCSRQKLHHEVAAGARPLRRGRARRRRQDGRQGGGQQGRQARQGGGRGQARRHQEVRGQEGRRGGARRQQRHRQAARLRQDVGRDRARRRAHRPRLLRQPARLHREGQADGQARGGQRLQPADGAGPLEQDRQPRPPHLHRRRRQAQLRPHVLHRPARHLRRLRGGHRLPPVHQGRQGRHPGRGHHRHPPPARLLQPEAARQVHHPRLHQHHQVPHHPEPEERLPGDRRVQRHRHGLGQAVPRALVPDRPRARLRRRRPRRRAARRHARRERHRRLQAAHHRPQPGRARGRHRGQVHDEGQAGQDLRPGPRGPALRADQQARHPVEDGRRPGGRDPHQRRLPGPGQVQAPRRHRLLPQRRPPAARLQQRLDRHLLPRPRLRPLRVHHPQPRRGHRGLLLPDAARQRRRVRRAHPPRPPGRQGPHGLPPQVREARHLLRQDHRQARLEVPVAQAQGGVLVKRCCTCGTATVTT